MKTVIYSGMLGILALITSLSAGCRLCCAPYDYCGPVYDCGNCANLMTNRCGSGVHGRMCGEPPAYQSPVQVAPQNMPEGSNSPNAVPPTTIRGPHVQYMPGRNHVSQGNVPTQGISAPQSQSGPILPPVLQQPQMVAAQPQVGAQAQIPAQPQGMQMPPGTMVVPQQGPMEVQVYDENGRYLGTEIIDAQGNTTNQVAPPAVPAFPPLSSGAVMQNPQVQYSVPPAQKYPSMFPQKMNYPQTPVLPVSGGGWTTRSQQR